MGRPGRVRWGRTTRRRGAGPARRAPGPGATAIGLDPNEAHYYFTHGVTLEALGHLDQARQALQISLRMEPENPVAQHRLAVLDGQARDEAPVEKKRGWSLFKRKKD